MKIRKPLVITIVAILSIIMSIGLFDMTASAAETTASGTCGDNLTWTLDGEGVLTISGSGEMKSYLISPWYDYRSSIKKVVIEEGVTSIGSYVFKGCSALTSITIPNSVKSIGNEAFDDCKELASITIPDSVTQIGYSAFRFCSKLESITIPFVGLSADATGDATCFGAIFGYVSSTSPFSDYHFEDDGYYYTFLIPSSLKNVTISNAASSIGDYAFNKCRTLTSIYIPYNVRNIGNSAFSGCSALENIYYGGTTSDKQAITVASGNNYLTDATWHYKICIGGSEHSYTSVVTPPTCTSKGYTTYTCDCGHKYISDYLDKTSHSLGDWYTKIYATCTSEGTERRDCSDCYYYETRTIRETPHDYTVTKTTTPNCTEPGRDIYTCFDCGHSYSTVYTPALGHDMSSWTYVSYATCTEDGNRWRKCIRGCGYREDETLPTNGHHYYDICDSVCDVCDAERTAPHNYVWVIDRESNCGIRGIKHQECTLCNTIIDENTVIAIKGNHVFDDGSDLVCNVCELEFVWLHFDSNGGSYVSSIRVRLNDLNKLPSSTSKSGYNFSGWSTEKNGHTEYPIGYSYYATEANTILYAQWNKHCATCSGTGKAPCYICGGDKLTERTEYYKCYSCNGDGSMRNRCINCYGSGCYSCKYTGYDDYTCSNCSGKGLLTVVVPINCPQCDNNGKQTCRDCNGTGNITRTHVSAPEKPEVESIYENTITLKEIENGEYSLDGVNWQDSPIFEGLEFDKEYSFYQRYAKTDTTYTSGASEVLKVTICGHAETEWIVDINPSCSKAGSKHEECTICKDVLSTETIEKLPHSYSSIVTDPTCTEQGYTTYTCVCGDEYVDDYVESLGHSYGAWYEILSPTCTKKGIETRTCSVCDHFETRDIPTNGHISGVSVVENRVEPDCITDGTYEHVTYCSICDEELSREEKIIAKLGHNYSIEWAVDVEPTCTESGVMSHHCTRCDDKVDITEIPAKGHSFAVWNEILSPTCTEDGIDRRDCEKCDVYETRNVSKLGHSKVYHDAKAPTCTEPGWNSYEICAKCDYTTYEKLDTLEHTSGQYVVENETASDCVNNGSYDNVVYCTVCDEELSRETITVAALGHTTGEVVVENNIAPDCENTGSYDNVIYCTVCDAELSRETIKIDALGHDYKTTWSSNSTSHWYECSCGEKQNVEKHVFDNSCDVDCNKCGYTRTTKHSFDQGVITKEPTTTEEGRKTYTCTVCGEKKYEDIDKLDEPEPSGGCYIATSVYGSYDCTEVWTLRRFRDNVLAKTWYGRAFVKTYYAVSPTLVEWFGDTNWFQNLWRAVLDVFVDVLNGFGFENTPYHDQKW